MTDEQVDVVAKLKQCSTCFDYKPHEDFGKHKRRRGGLDTRCLQCIRKLGAEFRANSRTKLFLYLSNGNEPCCACCGEKENKFLSVDHVDKTQHRSYSLLEHTKLNRSGATFYIYILWRIRKKLTIPKLQLLCHNCNMAKGLYGICPHKQQN